MTIQLVDNNKFQSSIYDDLSTDDTLQINPYNTSGIDKENSYKSIDNVNNVWINDKNLVDNQEVFHNAYDPSHKINIDSSNNYPQDVDAVDNNKIIGYIAYVWIAGVIGFLAIRMLSYMKLYMLIKDTQPVDNNKIAIFGIQEEIEDIIAKMNQIKQKYNLEQ